MQKVARNEICGGRSCGATLWKALIQPIHYHSPQAENYYSAVSLAEIMFVNTCQLSRIMPSLAPVAIKTIKRHRSHASLTHDKKGKFNPKRP